MGGISNWIYSVLAILLLCAGCATSPEVASRRQAVETEIEAILSRSPDPSISTEAKRCLGAQEYRGFRALDDRRILFEGRGDQLWLNTLPNRCPDLEYADILRVRSISTTRLCRLDTFQPGDWFDWPWYRRWPWQWASPWGSGVRCSLGEFQPVSELQVAEIEALLKAR